MNSHVNRNRVAKQVVDRTLWDEQFKIVERDHMPAEVAIEMLCAPKARTTNRERKNWNDARCTIYTSTRTAIPEEEKVANQLKKRNWVQLGTQLRRVVDGREKAQRHFLFLQRQQAKLNPEKKEHAGLALLLERQIATLNLHAAGLDALRDAVETEVDRRKSFIDGLKTVAPLLADALSPKLVGNL